MSSGSEYYNCPMRLLTISNAKTRKGEKQNILTGILHLAPSTLSGYNVCPMATAGCKAGCLNTSGRAAIFTGKVTKNMTGDELFTLIGKGELTNTIHSARILKTRLFFEFRELFMNMLAHDIELLVKRANKKSMTLAIRLNGTSDIRWETIPVKGKNNIMELFPDIQFYDYTKLPNRRNIPLNYHLTFSLADGNHASALQELANGRNVAVVFRKELPTTFFGCDVIDGDLHDCRFIAREDSTPVIIGLRAKGKAKKDTTGFVKDL